MTTTAIQVTPSGPDTPPPVLATMTPISNAMGHLEHVPEKPAKAGKPILYSCGKNYHRIKTNGCKQFKEDKLGQKCKKVWDLATDFIYKKDEFASEIEVKAVPNPNASSKDIVTISYKDKLGNIKVVNQKEITPEIVNRMRRILTIVRPSRGSIPHPEPLQLSLPKETFFSKTCGDFLKKEFKGLQESLPDSAKESAFRHIVTAEAMIQGFQRHVNGLIKHKEDELNDPKKTSELPNPSRKKKEADLRRLKKLLRELEMIDRNALFRAVAHLSNLNANALGPKKDGEIQKAIDAVKLNVMRDLDAKEKERHDAHWISNKYTPETMVIGKIIGGFAFKPMEKSEIHNYALDAGNLLVEEQMEARNRSLEGEDKVKQTSVEQLIVQMMMNLENDKVHTAPSHPVFEGFDPGMQDLLADLIEAPLPIDGKDVRYYPKAYARIVHEHLKTTPVGNIEATLNALSSIPDEKYNFSALLK